MSDQPNPKPELVRDLMSVGVTTCSPDQTIDELTRFLLENDLEEIVVMEERQIMGVVSRDELVKAYAQDGSGEVTAEQVMRSEIADVPPDIPLKTAALLMLDKGVRTLYITHHAGGVEYPAAYISYRHLLRHLCSKDMQELNDLGIQSKRQSPIETFIQRRDEARRRSGFKNRRS
jgi:predicted transcriptional regulator